VFLSAFYGHSTVTFPVFDVLWFLK
jgi:hypothetical protein